MCFSNPHVDLLISLVGPFTILEVREYFWNGRVWFLNLTICLCQLSKVIHDMDLFCSLVLKPGLLQTATSTSYFIIQMVFIETCCLYAAQHCEWNSPSWQQMCPLYVVSTQCQISERVDKMSLDRVSLWNGKASGSRRSMVMVQIPQYESYRVRLESRWPI